MPSLADLRRAWLLKSLGLNSSLLSEADLLTRLYSATGGVGSNKVFASGRYYRHSGNNASPSAGTAPSIDVVYYVPFEVGKTTRFDRFCLETTVAGGAGSLLSFGIYDSINGLPGNRLTQVTGVDGNVIAFIENVIDITLSPGIYWLAYVVSVVAPTVRTYGGHVNEYVAHTGNPGANNYSHYTNASAVLPAVAATPVVGGSTLAPMFLLRAA